MSFDLGNDPLGSNALTAAIAANALGRGESYVDALQTSETFGKLPAMDQNLLSRALGMLREATKNPTLLNIQKAITEFNRQTRVISKAEIITEPRIEIEEIIEVPKMTIEEILAVLRENLGRVAQDTDIVVTTPSVPGLAAELSISLGLAPGFTAGWTDTFALTTRGAGEPGNTGAAPGAGESGSGPAGSAGGPGGGPAGSPSGDTSGQSI